MKTLLLSITGAALLSFGSLIYAAEQGQHYLGIGLLPFDELQEIRTDGPDAEEEPPYQIGGDIEEEGYYFVWDFFFEKQAAVSLTLFSAQQETRLRYTDGARGQDYSYFSGVLVAGKYFVSDAIYLGAGIARSSLSGDSTLTNWPDIPDVDSEHTSDSFLAPTLVIGFREVVSRSDNSDFYIGADWIRTTPANVNYEATASAPGYESATVSGQYKNLRLSMIGVSFGWVFN